MDSKVWFDDFSVLFNKKHIHNFFPTLQQTNNEKINSISRFIILNSLILYIYNSDISYIFGGLLLLLCVYMFAKRDKKNPEGNFREGNKPICRRPTVDNPMGNMLPTKKFDDLEACDVTDSRVKKEMHDTYNATLYYDLTDLYEKKNSERQFYSTPVSKVCNDQVEFAEWLYGSKNKKVCRTDMEVCTGFENGNGVAG